MHMHVVTCIYQQRAVCEQDEEAALVEANSRSSGTAACLLFLQGLLSLHATKFTPAWLLLPSMCTDN
jgi:hypothetical protein